MESEEVKDNVIPETISDSSPENIQKIEGETIEKAPDIIEEKKTEADVNENPIKEVSEIKEMPNESNDHAKSGSKRLIIPDLEAISDIKDNGISTPPLDRDYNDRECTSPSSPRVFVSLMSPSRRKKCYSPEIGTSLIERMNMAESKLSNLRVKQKAEEFGKMRAVPEINEKSRKIAEGKLINNKSISRKTMNKDNESESSEQFVPPPKEIPKEIDLDYDLLRESIKLRENLKEKKVEPTQLNLKLGLNERAKIIKEKKAKKIEDAIKVKKNNEMIGCTFKPKLCPKNQISDSGSCIIKRSQSGRALISENSETAASQNNVRGFMSPRAKAHVFEEHFQITHVSIFSSEYSQISPVEIQVRYKHGFHEAYIRAKAVPMVDYKLSDLSID